MRGYLYKLSSDDQLALASLDVAELSRVFLGSAVVLEGQFMPTAQSDIGQTWVPRPKRWANI
eukprot:scaffold650078_cov50-Prasinocladus_malaysianus.AAC.1